MKRKWLRQNSKREKKERERERKSEKDENKKETDQWRLKNYLNRHWQYKRKKEKGGSERE